MRFLVVGFMMIAAAMAARTTVAATAVERGAFLFKASGCAGCHTRVKPKGNFLAGGRRLATPFGVFFPPNITPDPIHGIGAWSEGDFRRAMREGRAPDGTVYYPSFPYPSYTGMSDADLGDLWTYLRTVPAVAEASPGHALDFPFNLRILIRFWRGLYFTPGAFRPDAGQSMAWNRGAYLVRALGHCGECHTPRNLLGGLDGARELSGNRNGPEGKRVSNITPHRKKGIGAWSAADIVALLRDGDLPDGDIVGGAMIEVVENGTAHLTMDDLRAIAVYLRALPADAGP